MTASTTTAPPAELIADLRARMRGDVDASTLTRALYSSDASSYRVVPLVVVSPKDDDDVAAILEVARKHKVPVTARGSGTSIAGNAIGTGIIIDFLTYMNAIEIDPENSTATVQPGAILGDIQKAAAPFGLRFGPDPSTWPRASIGGTIGNNACGAHALAYGRAADQVISLECFDGTGRRFTAAQDMSVIPGLEELVMANLATIRTNFGRFKRQVSGYSMEHLLPENGTDLAKFISGSEGSIAIYTKATIRLVPLAPAPALVVLGYPTIGESADAVPPLLPHEPLALEGIDSRMIDVVHRQANAHVPDLPEGNAWLMVEVGGETADEALAKAHALAADAGTDHVMVLPAGPEASAIWQIRADGAGLGGRTPSGKQAWMGFEDAAVPPERLGGYLRDFEQLLADYGFDGLLYGHYGDGCVHIRIDFPLETADGVDTTMDFMYAAADLVMQYEGSISGEHGDGRTRGELLSRMYPPDAIELFEAVKDLFDPKDAFNPGIIARPLPMAQDLRRPAAASTGAKGFAFKEDNGDFTTALHRCTSVAKCRQSNTASGGFMCPSFQATGQEKDATRGRAHILQEVTNGTMITSWGSQEVRQALDLCLACKACSSDCPAGVDMAKYRSESLYRAFKGKVRPITHYLLGQLPRWSTMVRKVPFAAHAVNTVTKLRFVEKTVLTLGGMDSRRRMVRFETNPVDRWFKKRQKNHTHGGAASHTSVASTGHAPHLEGHSDARQQVLVWADSFSQSLDSTGAKDLIELLDSLGYEVILAPDEACCGLTWITTGQLDGAKKRLTKLAGILGPLAANGIPIVGVEPSCTAVLRDDILDLLPNDPRARLIADNTFTLAELLMHREYGPRDLEVPNLEGVEIVAQTHCHHYSVMGWHADERLLARTGATLVKLSGCCGLAGNFGMEKGHYDVSVKVGENSLLPALDQHPDAIYLADGFSCRTQAEQLADRGGIHLATLLKNGAATS